MLRSSVAVAVVLALVVTSLPIAASDLQLADGTRVRVRLLQTISSETSKPSEPVNLEVVEDVVVDGLTIIKQGTPVSGVITEAEPRKRMGRAGKLVFGINETRAVDRQIIRLRASQTKEGQSHVTGVVVTTAIAAALLWPAAPFMLLRRGKPIGSPEGTRFDAFVDGDHTIRGVAMTTTPANAPENVAAPATASSQATLSNNDVIALVKAGIGDEVVIGKIQSSVTAFLLGTDDLVQLKQAGVSDRVLAAMLQSGSRPAPATAPVVSPVVVPAQSLGRQEWQTNLPATRAYLMVAGDRLEVELVGTSQYAGHRAELRRQGDEYIGPGTYESCASTWRLRRAGQGWQGSIDLTGCAGVAGAGSRVGVLLTRSGT